MTKVHLAPGLSVPAAELATKVVAALGMRGSGKSNVMGSIAEQLLAADIQVIVFDDVGIHFSLRLAANGKSPSGLNIPVLGGRHGDIPLLPTAGELVAKSLAETGSSAVLDISGFRKGERARFAAAFAETLFRAKQQHPGPCFLILEESQRWVPQVIRFKGEGEERMLGAFMEIAEVGRNYGIGMGLISQRPQKIHKEVLNLTELLFAFQTNGVLERKAIAEWVQETGAEGRAEVHNDLPSLTTGEALVWSPAWLRLFKRCKLPKKTTYDAGATPLTARAQVKTKPLELGELSKAMAAVTEQAKANDPKALQAEVARLKRELAAGGGKGKAAPAAAPKVIERIVDRVPPALHRLIAGLGKDLARVISETGKLSQAYNAIEVAAAAKVAEPGGLIVTPGGHTVRFQSPVQSGAVPHAANGVRKPAAPRAEGDLSRAARALLTAIAQMDGRASDPQISILSGYSVNSSSFANAKGELRSAGLIDYQGDDRLLTDAGRAATGDVQPAPTGEALLRFWAGKLNGCERSLLTALWEHGPLDREPLASAAGYSFTSSSFANGLGALRSAKLISPAGIEPVALSESFRR
jgi:uncharacterized protein